ncbi:NifU family protein [Acetobacteroides hydrogenigenes]|uniref:Fe-S cluster biogenesis protein NfuA n=1 Tax=Acetobacteroides hydrogenigenes TaxID=979970 RepID=A0A4R2EJI3_9BACT|nr:Fe-S cluster biogenesis protein NfuA [Acetobacteroides hydrogenigenes]
MEANDSLVERIEKALDTIRPFLKNDGGDVQLAEITPDMVVKVVLLGACGSCPFSLMTLKNGIELAIKRDVPEVKEVISIQDNEVII